MTKKHLSTVASLLCIMLLVPAGLFATTGGSTTIGGTTGYLVIPSAETSHSGSQTTVTTGYSAVISNGTLSSLPYLLLGFSDQFEAGVTFDVGDTTDILVNGKWVFSQSGGTSMAIGTIAQVHDVGTSRTFADQLYFASTFDSKFIDWPAKTTILAGYTFDGTLDSDIDFGMAFETPFFEDTFDDKIKFLIDFGNVSYSVYPDGGNASDRGMVNIGLRLVPVQLLQSVYISADLRALDLFDANGRAISVAAAITVRPSKTF
jgi:hypothetical protein